MRLGFSLEETNSIEDFIQKIKTMQMLGIDTLKLKFRDTIESLAQKSRNNKKAIRGSWIDSRR